MTDGQSVEAQLAALTDAGAGRVFLETASGAKTDRAQLRRATDKLGADDLLMVTRLDRLARSTRSRRSPARTPAFRFIGDTWADTTTPHGRLMLTALRGVASSSAS